MSSYNKLPEWLRIGNLDISILIKMKKLTEDLQLHTVCESAHCPNRQKCYAQGTAGFMILGDICTRNCTFCAVKKGHPTPLDLHEPEHIVEAVKKLGLKYVVVTSVTRDDLPDGGASHFAKAINAIHLYDPRIDVEVLIPDFKGSLAALQVVIDASPTVLNHNVETVPRLYPEVRPEADYLRSIKLLKRAKDIENSLLTKSGLMLGLGESKEEIIGVMEDLREVNCELLTIGQYLQPSPKHHKVVRFVPPPEFEEYKEIGEKMGFKAVASAPFVRSSFHAAAQVGKNLH
jgi:lipoic acid synthetase